MHSDALLPGTITRPVCCSVCNALIYASFAASLAGVNRNASRDSTAARFAFSVPCIAAGDDSALAVPKDGPDHGVAVAQLA